METKSQFLIGIKAPDYHPRRPVTKQSTVHTAILPWWSEYFAPKGVDKGKKYMNRERFVDTWVKINGSWKCGAAITVLIPSKQASD